MNPLYHVVISSVLGQKRSCPRCRESQVVDRLGADRRYHCKRCGHRFTKAELKPGLPR